MRLWTKIGISVGAVFLCLVASSVLTESFSSIPDRFVYPMTTAADQTPATVAQTRANIRVLSAEIQHLQRAVAAKQQAARPAIRFLYRYHSGAENVWFNTVAGATDVSTAMGNVESLSSELKQDDAVLSQLQQSEHQLAAARQQRAQMQHLLQVQTSQHGRK